MAEPWYTTAFGAHYRLLYAHRDRAEARRCVALLPSLAPLDLPGPGGIMPILDLGCGDGRHLAALGGSAGLVVGLDLSRPLLAAAKDTVRGLADRGTLPQGTLLQGTLPLVCGDMLRLPLRQESCGAVLSLFTAFGYLGDLPANAPVVGEIARVLATGGHWFLDYLDCDRVRRDLQGTAPDTRQRTAGPLQVQETRSLAGAGTVVVKDVRITPGAGQTSVAVNWGVPAAGLAYREQVALFTLDELDLLAGARGLRRVAGAGDYGGSPLGSADRWLLVFRKERTSPGEGGSA